MTIQIMETPSESLPLLPTMPVTPHERTFALRAVLISVVVFFAFAFFATVPLQPITAFIPLYESALILNDLITVVLLLGHFRILRTNGLLVLACGYLFTALMTIPHALTFPGLFSPSGLLHAGTQSTAWIYIFWHGGFPLFVIAYSLLNHRDREMPMLVQRPHLAVLYGISAVVAMVVAFTVLATIYQDALPPILVSGHYPLIGRLCLAGTWLFSVAALVVLWKRRLHSMLNLWLVVVMCAWIFDIALSAVLNAGRYDVGFYAGRIFGLLAGSCVLIVLLLENNKLYARLVTVHEEVVQRTKDLQRLNEQNEHRATQYAKALKDLHFKEEEIRAVVQNINDCVITFDSHGIIKSANPSIENIFGYSVDEVTGRPISVLVPQLDSNSHPFVGDQANANDEMDGLHKDRHAIPLEMAINSFILHGERSFIGTFRDISERKRFITELKEARSSAEQANRAKSTFLSTMSHELRTPLNAILGFSQIMASSAFPVTDDKRKEFIAYIIKAGKHLLQLINEVLDLAKVESGVLSLSLEPIKVADIMHECEEMIAPIAAQHEISLLLSGDDNLCVTADHTRFKQVLLNLLSNAVKYNRPNGTVTVRWHPLPTQMIRISVEDSGDGLNEAQLAQLFQPFNRLGKEVSHEEGTGIGLVMTKRLVELMHGSIGVTSTGGVGTTFWIELKSAMVLPNIHDLKTEKENMIQTAANTDSGVDTILYVEDNAANRILVQEIIKFRPNLQLITARDGKSGIETAHAHHPAVILMDINLPDMSGHAAMSALRTDASFAHTPIIAVTANAMMHDIIENKSTGFYHYLTKPIDIEKFFEVLDSALKSAKEAGT